MRRAAFFTLILILFSIVALTLMAEENKEKPKHEFVGAKKCKSCHSTQYKSWIETPHAMAFDALCDDEKEKPECVSCHITGKLADNTVLEGVQCEACHGAGSDYKSMKIMSMKKWKANPEAHKKMAIDAGLIYPTEETCKNCHKKEGNPNYKEFDFAKRKGKVHAMKSDSTGTGK